MELSVGRDRLIVNCGAFPAGPAGVARRRARHRGALHAGDRRPDQQRTEAGGAGPAAGDGGGAAAGGQRRALAGGQPRRLEASCSARCIAAGCIWPKAARTSAARTSWRPPTPQPFTRAVPSASGRQRLVQQDGEAVLLRLRSAAAGGCAPTARGMTLEESIYLGGPEPRRSEQVVLTGLCAMGPQQVKWAISKGQATLRVASLACHYLKIIEITNVDFSLRHFLLPLMRGHARARPRGGRRLRRGPAAGRTCAPRASASSPPPSRAASRRWRIGALPAWSPCCAPSAPTWCTRTCRSAGSSRGWRPGAAGVPRVAFTCHGFLFNNPGAPGRSAPPASRWSGWPAGSPTCS